MSVADAAFERPQSLFAGPSLGDLLVVVGTALAVAVAHLGDSSHVEGVVQLAAAPHRQPVDLLLARGDLYRGRAVVSREVVFVGETADVAGEADSDRSHHRADAEGPDRGSTRCGHDGGQALLELLELGVEALEA